MDTASIATSYPALADGEAIARGRRLPATGIHLRSVSQIRSTRSHNATKVVRL